jgi:hypothetical protein
VRSGRLTEAQARDVSIVSKTLDEWIRFLTAALLSCVIAIIEERYLLDDFRTKKDSGRLISDDPSIGPLIREFLDLLDTQTSLTVPSHLL